MPRMVCGGRQDGNDRQLKPLLNLRALLAQAEGTCTLCAHRRNEANMRARWECEVARLVIVAGGLIGGARLAVVAKVQLRRVDGLGQAGVQLEACAAHERVALRHQPVVRRDQPAAVLLQLLRACCRVLNRS